MSRTGALLVNLGTPASPRPRDVRRYLRQFLSDPRVIDLPAPARWLLLEAVILPFRPRRSAAAYAKIWTSEGSPLLVHGRALARGVAKALGDDFVVELGMRYGEPSIASAVARLRDAGADPIRAIPLFPQYSEAASGSALAETARALGEPVDSFCVRESFYDDPGFVAALAKVSAPALERFRPDFVLLSYHGLPERQVRRMDPTGGHCLETEDCCHALVAANRRCYRAHCMATSRALARALGLAQGTHATAFQSRLGRTPWIQPFTDEALPRLRERGVARLAVACPSFVSDCLETLEEIGLRARDQWRDLGGEALELVPCLNAEPAWVETLASWFRDDAARQGG